MCDTHLDAWATTRNLSPERLVIVRSGNIRSALFRFDLSSLPATADVQSATLRLHVSERSNSLSLPIEVYRLRRAWDCASATWNQAGAAQPWGRPGADDTSLDRDALPTSRVTLSQVNVWISLDATELVRRWVAEPAQNHGLLIKGGGESSTEYRFTSSNYANENLRPQLVVTYR